MCVIVVLCIVVVGIVVGWVSAGVEVRLWLGYGVIWLIIIGIGRNQRHGRVRLFVCFRHGGPMTTADD